VAGDLAMAKDEVKARLAPIPVYTVANPKNEFVLVAGEVGGGRRGGCRQRIMAAQHVACGSAPGVAIAIMTPRTVPLLQNNTQLGFFFFKKEDAEAIISKVMRASCLPGLCLAGNRVCARAQSPSSSHRPYPCLAIRLQIKDENPRLARDSKILRVTMDNVYEVFTTPRDQTGLQVCAAAPAGVPQEVVQQGC